MISHLNILYISWAKCSDLYTQKSQPGYQGLASIHSQVENISPHVWVGQSWGSADVHSSASTQTHKGNDLQGATTGSATGLTSSCQWSPRGRGTPKGGEVMMTQSSERGVVEKITEQKSPVAHPPFPFLYLHPNTGCFLLQAAILLSLSLTQQCPSFPIQTSV